MTEISFSDIAERDIIHLLEVITEFDHRSGLEHSLFVDHQLTVLQRVDVALDEKEIRTTLNRQKAFAWHINSMCVPEMLNSSAGGSLELCELSVGGSDRRRGHIPGR